MSTELWESIENPTKSWGSTEINVYWTLRILLKFPLLKCLLDTDGLLKFESNPDLSNLEGLLKLDIQAWYTEIREHWRLYWNLRIMEIWVVWEFCSQVCSRCTARASKMIFLLRFPLKFNTKSQKNPALRAGSGPANYTRSGLSVDHALNKILEPAPQGMGAPQAKVNTPGYTVDLPKKPLRIHPDALLSLLQRCLSGCSPPPMTQMGVWAAPYDVIYVPNGRMSS